MRHTKSTALNTSGKDGIKMNAEVKIMRISKRIAAAAVAAAMCLALFGCTADEERNQDMTTVPTGETEATNNTQPQGDTEDTTQPAGITEATGTTEAVQPDGAQTQVSEETQPEDASGQEDDLMTLILSTLEENGREYGEPEASEVSGEYGQVEASYASSGNSGISVIRFDSSKSAETYSGYFSSDGSSFDSGSESKIIDYNSPVHLWVYGSYIIQYNSPVGEDLQLLNGIFGYEFAGAGSDYFFPPYATELVNLITDAGFTCATTWVTPLQQLYMYQPDSMCRIMVSNGDEIILSYFSDETRAIDHAARFSANGKAYTGFQGNDHMTIELGRKAPVHLFRKGGVVADYCDATPELLPILDEYYGPQFAGEPYDAVGEPEGVNYGALFIRTDCIAAQDIPYPQYIVIRSRGELMEYYEKNKSLYDLESRAAYGQVGWLDFANALTDEWFEQNDLVLIILSEPSGSITHEVASVTQSHDGSHTVTIRRNVPEIGTDDMAQWHLFLSVESEKLSPLEVVDIVIE